MSLSTPNVSNWKQLVAFLETDPPIRLAYIDCPPPYPPDQESIILLLHGFPQTSHQFRHVITPLAAAGYRVIAPDYRGAGASSKPASGFTKSAMAEDILMLLDCLGIDDPIHLVGHDIGGMIAYAFASRYHSRVMSVVWGECPLPGTVVYHTNKTTRAVQQFHFIFHSVLDLPEALVAGRERIYLDHFFSKLIYNAAAISSADLDHYSEMYSQPGAMRCALEVYRAFEIDAQENRHWIDTNGKSKVPAMALSGDKSAHKDEALEMFSEVHEQGIFEVAVVEEAGHYIAEENPEGFTSEVLRFVRNHSSLSAAEGEWAY
jgi:pimeloyl-ACP methyl ester carboxylesterase